VFFSHNNNIPQNGYKLNTVLQNTPQKKAGNIRVSGFAFFCKVLRSSFVNDFYGRMDMRAFSVSDQTVLVFPHAQSVPTF